MVMDHLIVSTHLHLEETDRETGYPANGSLHTQSHVTTEKIPTMLPVEDTPNMDYEIVVRSLIRSNAKR
jgi:hypothetical protein